jgi:NhaP-type Na+/H+ or K+/H+ antiporter
MLAVAGAAAAFVPGAPTICIDIDPQITRALFIAPVLFHAAYDFPVITASALWRPLVVLAAEACRLWRQWLPSSDGGQRRCRWQWRSCLLGAIVAPPAAAVAVLGTVVLPRRTIGVLKGESLFNDAWHCCCSTAR